jgi:V8-like Glu-specific endopeptidase
MSNGRVTNQEAGELETEAEGTGESEPEVGGAEETQPEASEQDAHTSVSYTIPSTTPPTTAPGPGGAADEGGEAGAEAGEESAFESVEGWEETVLQEAASDETAQESTVDAYYAEADQQEFFQFLAPFLPIVAKAVIPALTSAVGQQLSPRIRQLLASIGRRRPQRGGSENAEEAFFDEAAVLQQLEQLEVIIGTDDRVQITTTNQVPYRRICHLAIVAQSGKRFLGTGAFIGRNTVVTAGHCVYLHGQGGWAREITVTPGRNVNTRPFGQARATQLRSVRGWTTGPSSTRRNYDYGAIIIAPNGGINTNQVGAFGFAAYTDQFLLNKRLNLAGYPGDKAAGTMWYHGRRATRLTPRTIEYDIDTAGGQSGSPVWLNLNGVRNLAGIHTNGSASANSATRITAPVLANLRRWRTDGGS